MKLVYLLMSILVFSCIYSCTYHDTNEPIDCIYEVTDSCDLPDISIGPFGTTMYEYDSVMYYAPCFNPNNSNEFVYIEERPYVFKSDLYTYNMLTGEKKYLSEGADYFPKWSKNNWIIFNRGSQLWKIKSTGDSLMLLLSNGEYYDAEVSPSGEKIICRGYGDYYKTIVCDINGNILDTLIDEYFGEGSWSFDGNKISTRRLVGGFYQGSSFGFYDSLLTTFVDVVLNSSSDPEDFILDTEWFPNSQNILWYGSGRYSVTNTLTGETTLFSEYCESNYNFFPTFSTDGSKMLWEKNERDVLNTCDGYYVKTSIVLTDENGENEQIILK